MIIFSRKTHGCWVPTFLETSRCLFLCLFVFFLWFLYGFYHGMKITIKPPFGEYLLHHWRYAGTSPFFPEALENPDRLLLDGRRARCQRWYLEIWHNLHRWTNGKGDIFVLGPNLPGLFTLKTQQLASYPRIDAEKRCFKFFSSYFHHFFFGGGALLATWQLRACEAWDRSPFKNGKTRVQNLTFERSAPSPGSRTPVLVGHEWTHHCAFSLSCCCFTIWTQ